MAIFGKKSKGEGDAESGEGALQATSEAFSPEKAKVFFDRAKTTHDTTNYEYAVTLWLNGLSQDPASIPGFEGFVRSIDAYVVNGGKKATGKDIQKSLNGQGQIKKFQEALLNWGLRQHDPSATLKAADAAGKVGAQKTTEYLGRRAFEAARADKKQKKEVYVKLLDVFEAGGAFDLAVEAGVIAKNMDPGDGALDARVKDMMGRAAISRGGFEDGGEGGFRKNIRDLDKQSDLEAEDRLTKTEDVKDRIVNKARAALEERPGDLPTIEKLGKALVDRGKGRDLLEAMTLYNDTYKETDQFRFRQAAGDVQIKMAKLAILKQTKKAEAAGIEGEEQEKLDKLRKQLADMQVRELKLRVENYPTDLKLKFELGRTHFEREEYDAAIEQLQLAQEDAQVRRPVQNMLAQSFLKIGWEDAAINTFRSALDGIPDEGSDLALDLKYGLGCSLAEHAEKNSDQPSAEEAEKLFTAIAMKNFNYKDIKERREHVKQLLQKLRG